MESMAVGQCIHAGLSRLSTSKGIGRRDSLSSSRTRDSGYNSDLDALSPLDFPGFKQGRASRAPGPCAMLPDLPEMVGTTSSPQSVFFLEDGTAVQDECIEKWIRENLPSDSRTKERISSIASLSSTRSSDMYTNTDASEDDQEPDNAPMLNVGSLSTRKLVEFILRKVDLSLRQEAYKQCTNQSTSAHRNAANVAPRPSHDTPWQNAGTKRKSRTEGSPPPDEDEDGQHKRRRESAVTMSDESDTIARFACPFYKHDPDRYRNRRTCPGPGWPTVHRMKEHLYRSHAQPIFCPICYATFKSDKEQSYHVRLQQCQRSAPQHIDGIDRETVWTLRKRTTALRLEEDKWRDVYHVLFPEVLLPDIPSPCTLCHHHHRHAQRRSGCVEKIANQSQHPGSLRLRFPQRIVSALPPRAASPRTRGTVCHGRAGTRPGRATALAASGAYHPQLRR